MKAIPSVFKLCVTKRMPSDPYIPAGVVEKRAFCVLIDEIWYKEAKVEGGQNKKAMPD